MNRLFILTLFVIANISFSKECITISGEKKDHNFAFANAEILKKEVKVGSFICKVFNSWVEADEYISKSNLKRGEKLLIFQGAHGSKGGDASCNIGDIITGERINSYLRKYSKKYKTAAIINSCYSGDLLKSKLLNDFVEQDYNSMKNLCLITTSSFNKLSYGADNLEKIEQYKIGLSIKDVFQKRNDVLKSYALWDSAGIPKFLVTKDISSAKNVFSNLDQILSSNLASCPQKKHNNVEFLRMCANPKVSNEVLSAIIGYQEVVLRNSDSIENFLKEGRKYISMILNKEVKNPKEISKLTTYEKSCIQDYVSWFEFYLRGHIGRSEDIDEFLKRVTLENKNKEGTACNLYLREKNKQLEKRLKEAKNNQFSPYGGSGFNITEGQSAGIGGGSNILGKTTLEQNFDLRHLWALNTQAIKVEEARKKLLKALNVEKVNNTLSPSDVVEILNTDSSSCRSESDNIKILSNLLGEFNYTYLEDESANPRLSRRRNFSSYNLMTSFNAVSLKAKKIKNKSDSARNKACESFKF